MKFFFLLFAAITFISFESTAQDYNAIHGSNYSGSLGVYNNPASIVNTPYKWDLTVFGMQYQTITNAVRGPNFPFNLSPSGEYFAASGNYKRHADLNYNLRLLNGRFSLNDNSAFAFGVNFRGYTQVNTSTINYHDSVFGPRTFLFYNLPNEKIDLALASSLWMELYGSYGTTMWNNEISRLNAGASLKISRGMSGAFVKINDVGVVSGVDNDQTVYKVSQGTGSYGYSANHGTGESFSAGDLFSGSRTGFALDLGIEYLVKTQAVSSVFDAVEDHDYEWKIGVALLDLGWNNFAYSSESRAASQFRENISSQALSDKFSEVDNASTFNDSVATIVNSFETLSGNFKIFNPARAVINVDRYISGNVFINGELSVNLASGGRKNHAVREPKLLTITPRWETRKLGFFMPVQVNRYGNFWIGGAIKAGPLLLGTHNLLNAFSKNKYIGGGAYLALTIRPVNLLRSNKNRQQYECPEY